VGQIFMGTHDPKHKLATHAAVLKLPLLPSASSLNTRYHQFPHMMPSILIATTPIALNQQKINLPTPPRHFSHHLDRLDL
jgi:hypothetical protein